MPVVRTTDHVGATVSGAGRTVAEGGAQVGEAILLGGSDIFHGVGRGFDELLSGRRRRRR